MYHISLTHSSVSGHLGCFHVLYLENMLLCKLGLHPYFQIRVLSGYMPQNVIAGSYDNSVFNFKQSPYYFP